MHSYFYAYALQKETVFIEIKLFVAARLDNENKKQQVTIIYFMPKLIFLLSYFCTHIFYAFIFFMHKLSEKRLYLLK